MHIITEGGDLSTIPETPTTFLIDNISPFTKNSFFLL